jgi:hypothetical protein
MCFRYDFAKVLSPHPWKQIFDFSIDLLRSLRKMREADEYRPLLFLCQSFGAIILKRVGSFSGHKSEPY